jgi:ankyrin repeat protein
MPSNTRFLTWAVVFFAAIFISNVSASAQTAVSYQFLEVVDSDGKPVAGATVKTFGSTSETYRTDEKGRVEKMEKISGDYNTEGFTVSKTGYYTFRLEFGARHSTENPIRVELLKIPATEAERKIIENERRRREFFEAARKGDVEAVRKFLKMGLSANLSTSDLRGVPGEKGVPIIVYAARSGDSRTVNELLAAGADAAKARDVLVTYLSANPYAQRYSEKEAERDVLLKEFEDAAGRLIESGADVRALGLNGETALIVAAQRGYFRTVKLLIEKGAPLNVADRSGRTALTGVIAHLENAKARFEMVELLLKAGADINLATGNYVACETPLIIAAWGRTDVKMVKFLLENGADVNKACENGATALQLVKKRSSYEKSDELQEMIKLLEAAGAKE